MTVRHMRIFLAVYRCGGITSAAQQLHMTQPAVTRAIQELESYYGVKLFERMGRRLPVTEEGRLVGMVSLADLSRRPDYMMEAAEALEDICAGVRRMDGQEL